MHIHAVLCKDHFTNGSFDRVLPGSEKRITLALGRALLKKKIGALVVMVGFSTWMSSTRFKPRHCLLPALAMPCTSAPLMASLSQDKEQEWNSMAKQKSSQDFGLLHQLSCDHCNHLHVSTLGTFEIHTIGILDGLIPSTHDVPLENTIC